MAGEIHFLSEMPRKPRFAPPNYALHITQRGNYQAVQVPGTNVPGTTLDLSAVPAAQKVLTVVR